uniref:Uncharacterized protein n=1 Tax=Arundo donax TaxID=35708 RepID=A0A0A9EA59_ARUDO
MRRGRPAPPSTR